MLRRKNQSGAAAVEAALVLCFIVIPLVFAAIAYASMLTFRQTVSQSATEGARAAAVAPAGLTDAELVEAAKHAISSSMSTSAGGMKCAEEHLTCTVTPTSCDGKKCITVKVEYPYREHSLLPSIPLLGDMTLPEMITYSATAEVN